MPISISTFAPGDVIDAANLRSRTKAIEDYVNRQIQAGDRTTNWMTSGHVYGPDFQYGSGYGAHLPFTGGHAYWSKRPNDDGRRALFSWYAGSGPVMVPGLTRTIQLPEGMSYRYRALILTSFWAFEYGGEGYNDTSEVTVTPFQDEGQDGLVAAEASLYVDGVAVDTTQRNIYSSSCATDNGWTGGTGGTWGAASGLIYCRKQISMVHAAHWSAAGIHTVGVGIRCAAASVDPAVPPTDAWKHIFVREGSFYTRYRIR